VYDTGDALILADGYHRVEAARRLGRTTIKAEVRRGSRTDALRFAVALSKEQRGLTASQALSAIKKRAGGRWAGGR
jgi:ParB-like chromosome segregation protein Spo0J